VPHAALAYEIESSLATAKRSAAGRREHARVVFVAESDAVDSKYDDALTG
jgi:hypothetical protein